MSFIYLMFLLAFFSLQDLADAVKGADIVTFTPELTDTMKQLWKDEGIQQAYARQSEFQLNDSAS